MRAIRDPYVTAVCLTLWLAAMSACQLTDNGIQIDDDDLGGVVTGEDGPEAGVWVIAGND